MTTQAVSRLYTAEDFYKLKDPPGSGKVELICGEVVAHMPVGGEHSYVAARALLRSGTFIERHALGAVGMECGFRISRNPDTVLAPDVHFVRSERLPGGRMPRSFFDGIPDLAIEVVSPDDSAKQLREKVAKYIAAGVPNVWVINPIRSTVTVYHPGAAPSVRTGSDHLTSADAGFDVDGFVLALGDLFE